MSFSSMASATLLEPLNAMFVRNDDRVEVGEKEGMSLEIRVCEV